MTQAARETGVVTQMGNQGHARDHLRRAVELIQGGALGRIEQVHCWTNRPIWPQGMAARPPVPRCPTTSTGISGSGPAPERPYGEGYHPFDWRGWWDFGTGALGDMGCHILDMPLWALGTGAPTHFSPPTPTVRRRRPLRTRPRSRFRLPAGERSDALDLVWYDGGRLPSAGDRCSRRGRRRTTSPTTTAS